MNSAADTSIDTDPPPLGGGQGFFARYFWFILKNILGVVFLAGAVVLGPLPGPGGVLLFLIGFGLISFPGKRRLMVRIFRGRKFPLRHWLPHAAAIVLALVLPIGVMWWFVWRGNASYRPNMLPKAGWLAVYGGLAVVAWLVIWGLLLFFNWLIKIMPKIRRTIRPWLRHRGVDLLPPRLRRRVHLPDGTFDWRKHPEGEIFRVHERHRARFRIFWNVARPWVKRAVSFLITLAIFALMMRPVYRNWQAVRPHVDSIHWGLFFVAAAMFALFLFAFRALAWRKILAGFGYQLPIPAATRIWSTSELARYLPGVIWQVVGRIYLVKPYGVSGTVCSVSQILELIVFMLANILVALSCLLWFGTKMGPAAKKYLYIAMALVPFLMLLLHPKVFYTALTKYMSARKKRLPERRVRGKTLTLLTVWAVVGLIWQGLALWILAHGPLGLPLAKWWIVAGTYCLAWCAGFLAFWAPGGLGVREVVFVGALMFALPPGIRAGFGDRTVLFAFLAFLGIVLRLWTIIGELMLATVAYVLDYRGALGRSDAPGRVVAPVEG